MEMVMFGLASAIRIRKTKTLVVQVTFTSCSEKFLQNIRFRLDKRGIQKGVLSKGKGSIIVWSIVFITL